MFSAVNREIETPAGLFVVPKDEPAPPPKLTPEVAQTERERVKSLQVTNELEHVAVSGELVRLKVLITRAKEIFDPICKKAHEAHAEACKQRAAVIDPLEAACKELEPKVAAYLLQQKQEEEKRQREAMRAEQAQAEALREQEIEDAEADGATPEEIAALCERPLDVVPVIVPRQVSRGPVSLRECWKGTVTDKLALIKHVASHPELANLLVVNQTALDQLARALKTAARIPGVTVSNQAGTSTRTAPRRGERS